MKMLSALPKTLWLRFNAIWSKQEKETPLTSVAIHSVHQQKMDPHEAYSQVRRNMY